MYFYLFLEGQPIEKVREIMERGGGGGTKIKYIGT